MPGDLRVLGACPLDCPDTCSWVVTVEHGRPVSLRGNPDHPYTRGALCVKVNRYLEHTRADDRILHPLRRTGPKGSGRFERITWEEALDEISVRLRGIVEEHGGEAIWPYLGTGSLGYLQGCEGVAGRRFWNMLGASKHYLNICSGAGNSGLRRTTGTAAGMDPENFALARLIVLWGTNTLTSGHHLWKFIQEARAGGAYVVAIDPIRTRTADQADEHLAIRPGTDAALALGLLNVVLAENAQDEEFLAEHTEGWDDFREEILRHPVERVAGITGISAEAVHRLGIRLARTRPTALRATHGLQRHAGGGTALRTIAAIPGVTGDWRHPGGGIAFSTSDHVHLAVDRRDDLLARPVRTLVMTKLASQLDDVKCLWVYAANPAGSSPDANAIKRQLAREDLFTVVMEQFSTDTVDYADIVLPATMQTEHMDLHAGYGHLYLLWNEPAGPPPGECLSTTETFRRLARHMGMTEPSLYDSDVELAEQLLSSGHPSLGGITLDRLRKEGWVRMNYPRPFAPFADGFPTPSGRLRFPPAKEAYVPPHSVRAAGSSPYRLTLITPASHLFLNTTFGNNPELRRRAKDPVVLVNPADAAERGLAGGQRVRVHNDGGEFLADVEISDRVAAGVVASPKGRWPKLTPGGANPNVVVAERDGDMGRGPAFHDNLVEISPV
ncbi:molybdopterin oxidoreductase family protein [Nonomuraea sp. KC401]|uniref:molybdopterin-containing oxidoreductase family protein n=1 Tax=unclassified Nonomuraea TaxID=2593643 RepID=UPI0010FD1EDA|nr:MULTISPECIES: molybdopterin-dependent oxidoreductase [unclassified Nonomuraea]NBE98784.1 molybdopterin-dependent oxidoreductase [Nonomuraea sp. K271]TLF59730.1 molybdopterin oxidoreductase family protein [Nonomuraea sp. KC401]